MCVYFFCIFLSSFLSCATQKNSLTLFVIKDTKDDDDDDFDDFDDGAECEERPKSPKEGTDESANQYSRWCSRFFFLRKEVFSVSKAGSVSGSDSVKRSIEFVCV